MRVGGVGGQGCECWCEMKPKRRVYGRGLLLLPWARAPGHDRGGAARTRGQGKTARGSQPHHLIGCGGGVGGWRGVHECVGGYGRPSAGGPGEEERGGVCPQGRRGPWHPPTARGGAGEREEEGGRCVPWGGCIVAYMACRGK